MSSDEEMEELLARMTRGEKAQLLQQIARDAFPGIDVTEGVAGGDPCIARTQVAVWTLVNARQLGANDAELLRSYPGLRAEDLVSAWAYARAHRAEIEALDSR